MEIKPLKRYNEPDFPTREILDVHPELLRRMPNRWRRSAVIGTAVVAACGIVAARWGQTTASAAGDPVSKVAPVFVHGEGHGAFGCEAVNPPVFLSEDEARQVIVEELKRAEVKQGGRLDPKPDGLILKGVAVPDTTQNWNQKTGATKRDLALDGWDAGRKIGFEYVSNADYDAWQEKDGGFRSTVSSFDMQETAKRLQTGLVAAKPEGAVAVFYDPLIGLRDAYENSDKKTPMNWEAEQADAKMIARFALREQVRDFVKWLKAEGVI